MIIRSQRLTRERLFLSFPAPIQSWERVRDSASDAAAHSHHRWIQNRALTATTARWLATTLILLMAASGLARASEPRPWLCRDKPVFSTSGASRMDLDLRDSHRWQVFLMQFDPSGGHDGFTITNSYDLGPGHQRATENLAEGRFFAVALYNSGGRWICPAPARDQRAPGTIASLCYSPGGGSCGVTLTIRSAK